MFRTTTHLLCVGAVYVDTILTVPHFPLEDEKLRAQKLTKRRGGNTANSLEVLSQLYHHAGIQSHLRLCAILPGEQSLATTFIATSLPDVEMGKSSIFRENEQDAASSYIIQNASNLSRTIVSVNSLAEMTLLEFQERVARMPDTTWVHFEGRIPEITLQCVQFLREKYPQCKVSVECEKPERTGMQDVAELADVVFYSKLWATKNGFGSAKTFLEDVLEKRQAVREVLLCCTWGAEGATAARRHGDGKVMWEEIEAWKPELDDEIDDVVDTIGAGGKSFSQYCLDSVCL